MLSPLSFATALVCQPNQAWLAFLEMICPARMLPKLLINRTPPLQAAPKSSLAENQSRLPDDKLKEIELFLQQFEQKCNHTALRMQPKQRDDDPTRLPRN